MKQRPQEKTPLNGLEGLELRDPRTRVATGRHRVHVRRKYARNQRRTANGMASESCGAFEYRSVNEAVVELLQL